MNNAKRNYLIDVVLGVAFLFAMISAVIFLIPTGWINFSSSITPTVLGLDFGVWQSLHKWAGIVMIIGALVHFILHWNWIVNMTKKMMPKIKLLKRNKEQESSHAQAR